MNTKPFTYIVDCLTENIDFRELNDEEFARWEVNKAQVVIDEEKRKAEEQAHKAKANTLVKKLAETVDLTDNEIAELLKLTI